MKKEVSINSNFVSLIANADKDNILDTAKVLNVKYGISNNKIAELIGIHYSSLSLALKKGSFEGIIKESKMDRIAEGVETLKEYYLV